MGVGPRKEDFHCDTYKATLTIADGLPMKLIPTRRSHIDTISYTKKGKLESSIDVLDTELNNIVRLNLAYLKERRRKSYQKIFSLSRDLSANGFNSKKMKRLLEVQLAKKDGYFMSHFPGLYEFMLKKYCSNV